MAHAFGQVRVRGPAEFAARLPELGYPVRLHQSTSGETGCDVSVGTPNASIHSLSPCTKPCTERHEAVHVRDLSPCCKAANKAYTAAKTDDKKTAVQDKMGQWILSNDDYFECRAYGESVRCAEEFQAAHCDTPKSTGSTGSPPAGERQDGAAMPNVPSTAAANGQSSNGALVNETLLEATPSDDKPGPAPPNPEICCSSVKEYARVFRIRRDIICGTAKKNPTACPF